MVRIIKKTSWEFFLVLAISITSTILTTIALLSQYIQRPKDRIFIGMIHYWEDLYYYLDQFYQGAHGSWLTTNNFTTEKFPPTTIYFIHLLLGKLGGILGLEPFTAYNLSVLFLKFFFILLSYYVIKKIFPHNAVYRLVIFCIFLFSSSFPEIKIDSQASFSVSSITLFRAENTIFSRFGNMPEILTRNIIFLLLLLLISLLITKIEKYIQKEIPLTRLITSKESLIILISIVGLFILLSISDAAKSLNLILVAGIYIIFHLPKTGKLKYLFTWSVIILIILLPAGLIIINTYKAIKGNSAYTFATQWDINQQEKMLSNLLQNPIEIIKFFGTLGIAALIGSYFVWKKEKNILESLGYLTVIIGVSGFFLPLYKFIPIPGFRLVFSSSYIFLAIMAFHALIFIKQKCGARAFWIVLIIYFVPNAITITSSTIKNSLPLKEPYYHFAYMPKTIFEALLFLRYREPKDAVVLANPATSIDMLVPGFSGKRTYSGHFLMTINAKEKDKLTNDFLYKWTDENRAKKFLLENEIKYIMWTKYSGDVNQIKRDYKFLKIIFENPDISIFSYD
ncbi:hypothetical protein A3D78_00560 [Candidatus Gottesmanbacteria bacterium RIFCSPHIGHO2_02_FULL_39_14]|uniref:Glycosyltransferase RgtA/B/C/D-like domain-containing protein n=2 Tax=Candidatus Gottesmaniibacteriota TaxID=1752720 RepID=A0A1F5ZXX3_9BACT|nr:MAG: hypothetical protein A3D78_00560 [Candidatus Gottesmanbacteria bacterium RIFCSPHIGHO2_02_FULL_39_14]OGG31540.1 MAG: hypothetical protein A3I51_01070 [Candidatus Gottesmanbacteria bacterium RIFCSPLOWO2_02_FULL_38_8]